jgi:hypothetical protein
MILEDDRLILHDLREVNLKVTFFLGTRKEYLQQQPCITYSICWDSVDVRVDQVTVIDQISELDFFYCTQQLFIDDHLLSGEVYSFDCTTSDSTLNAFCTILLGRDY